MVKLQKEQNKGIVRLHNNFVEAIYSLSVDAKKILLCVILHLDNKNKIKIHRTQMIKEIGIDPRKVNNLKDIFKELMSKVIEIRSLENKQNWELYQLLKATKYKDGILTTSIYPELLPYFKEAQERLFTRFNIQNIKPLTSIHAIRIYELAKQFDDTGWRVIDLEEFKKMLKIDNKYGRIYDLKRRVLEVAKKQINKNTDINIDYKLIKEGRRYTKLRLNISKNKLKVEHKENKKLIERGKFVELEEKLNAKYRSKSVEGKDGLTWHILRLKVLNDKEVEITLTNLSEETKIIRKINEL